MNTSLIIGMGEVGLAHARILSKNGNNRVYGMDLKSGVVPDEFRVPEAFKDGYDFMFIAIRGDIPDFIPTVKRCIRLYGPKYVNVLSTVPPGTCEKIGPRVVHSTTRGLHPNLENGLLTIPKHFGGPDAEVFAELFRYCGVQCRTHETARTTELAHILNNASYGVNLVWADEMQKICRKYQVDYYQAVMAYTETNNDGYLKYGHKTKQRMILTPPNGNIGGHCVSMSANLVPEHERTPMLDILAKYGGD